ncbi:hypothetical protein JCM8208_004722 [Rhodotorula glutinis]
MKRQLAYPGTPPASSSKRRKPSTEIVDLTGDDSDDDHDDQPAPGSSSSWIYPWRVLLTAGIDALKAFAAAGPGSAPLIEPLRRANGLPPVPSPRPLSSPRVRPDARDALKREYAHVKDQLTSLKKEHLWAKMDALSQGNPEPPKPHELVDLEARMKALAVEKKKMQKQAKAGDYGESSMAAGAAGYQRKRPMGSDKHKRTIAQRDADTLASLRHQSHAQSQSGSAGWAGAAGDEDEDEAPEAEDDLEQRMYSAMLESGLQQEQAKHDATSRPTPSRRASRLQVGRSVSGIVKPSALDLAGTTFPAASPYGLRSPAFPTTSTPPSSSFAPAAPPLARRRSPAPPLARRSSSNIDRVLATAQATMNEPIARELDAFEQFDRLREELKAADEEAKALEVVAKVKKRKFPKELPPADAARVKAILSTPRYESTMPGAAATLKDLKRLEGLSWLNDELVNFVGVLINHRSDEADKREAAGGSRGEGETRLRKAFVFNTNFFTWYGDSGFAKVKRWTRRFDTFAKDIIIVPINHNNSHWCCAAVNLNLKRFEYYDSFGKPAKFVYERLRNWLVEEHRNRKKSEIDLSDWTDYWYEDVPQQQNVSDCGVFTCMFMESLSREVDFFDFTQKNMPYLRNKMVLQIDKCDLLDVEPWV